jgi:ferredoxin-NADP reductase
VPDSATLGISIPFKEIISVMIAEALGAVIILGALGQVGLVTFQNLIRAHGESRRNRLDLELLQNQLEIMRDLRRKRSESALPWNGYRKFLVKKKVIEAKDICSFYLVPHDQRALPDFLPGQYLTFRLDIAGSARPVIRCYSLSAGPRRDGYRVTIKRIPSPDNVAPPGIVSSHFHDQVQEGDILDVKAPSGQFCLDPEAKQSVVLIGGGIGVTPVLSMLQTLITQGPTREIWFFYGVRNRAEHALKEELATIAREHPNVRMNICYSKPDPDSRLGSQYHHVGRVSVDLFRKVLPSNNFDYYICGPGPLMQSITEGLKDWGVPDAKIHFETFGPSSIKKIAPTVAAEGASQPSYAIQFKKSGKTINWTGASGNILELAEANGINIPSGCRAGSCGTCQVAVFSGEVAYLDKSDFETNPGTKLTCIGTPKSDLVLDA